MFVLHGVMTQKCKPSIHNAVTREWKGFQFDPHLLSLAHEADIAIEHIGFNDKRRTLPHNAQKSVRVTNFTSPILNNNLQNGLELKFADVFPQPIRKRALVDLARRKRERVNDDIGFRRNEAKSVQF
jgi:hypothetical protein